MTALIPEINVNTVNRTLNRHIFRMILGPLF